MSSEVAERYAEALFELACESNAAEEKKRQAESLLQILEANPELTGFFGAVKVTRAEKKDMITRVFSDSFDPDLVNFMKLLIDKGRMNSIGEIIRTLIAKLNEELGIRTATVYSARPLPETEMARIQNALEKKSGKKIELTNMIDERLIAGIKVVMGNSVTDVTMKSRLEGMKEALLRGGQV